MVMILNFFNAAKITTMYDLFPSFNSIDEYKKFFIEFM